jgi:hypothetical protein
MAIWLLHLRSRLRQVAFDGDWLKMDFHCSFKDIPMDSLVNDAPCSPSSEKA